MGKTFPREFVNVTSYFHIMIILFIGIIILILLLGFEKYVLENYRNDQYSIFQYIIRGSSNNVWTRKF